MPGYEVRQLFPGELDDMLELTATAYNSTVETFRRIYEDDPFYSFDLTRVAEQGGRLIGYMRAAPRTIWIGPAKIRMGGIAEVCTHPEYRRMGIASHLLREIIHLMADRGYPVSMLYGRSTFYGRLGWERCSILNGLRIQPGSLPAFREGEMMREYSPDDLPRVMSLYNSTYGGRSCAMTRNRLHWEGRILRRTSLLVCEGEAGVTGYLAYARREEELEGYRQRIVVVHEAGYKDEEAIRGIVGCLARLQGCDSIYYPAPVDDRLLSSLMLPGASVSARWDGMFRVNDVEGALSALKPVLHGSLALRVRDETRSENCGDFVLEGSDGSMEIRRGGRSRHRIEMDIRELSQLLPGTFSAGQLAAEGRIRASTPRALRLAEGLFPRRHPFQPPVDHF